MEHTDSSEASDYGAEIPVVGMNTGGKKRLQKMDKVLIIVVAAVLVIAVIVAAVIIHSKNKKSETAGAAFVSEKAGDESADGETVSIDPVTVSDDVSVTLDGVTLDYAEDLEAFAHQTSETQTVKPQASSSYTYAAPTTSAKSVTPEKHLEETTVITTVPAESSNNAVKVISSFFSGSYYFDGSMISGSEETPLEIAMDGQDFEMFTEMDGTDIAMMRLDGKLYLLNPSNKKYTEINSAVKKMMQIDDDMFEFEFNKIKFDAENPNSVTKASYKGENAVCYRYEDDETRLDFIVVNDEIKQMTMYKNGAADTVLAADEFTSEIPDDMLNFKGYSKTNMISFMSSMM